MKRGIPEIARPFSLPIVVILITLAATIWVLRPLWARIESARAQISQISSSNRILEAKLETLQSQSLIDLEEKVRLATTAVPVQNSALPALALLRQTAQGSGLTLGNVSATLGTKTEGIKQVTLKVEVEGPVSAIVSFLDQLETSLPLARVEKGNLNAAGAAAQVSAEVIVFWQELPATLPKVDQPLQLVTFEEESLLLQLSGFSQPSTFLEVLPSGQTRENPFSF